MRVNAFGYANVPCSRRCEQGTSPPQQLARWSPASATQKSMPLFTNGPRPSRVSLPPTPSWPSRRSLPNSPRTESVPGPPTRVSSPLDPKIWSLPAPPLIMSAPPLPTRKSSPAPPLITSPSSEPPKMLSLPASPFSVSKPPPAATSPPSMLSSPAPPNTVSFPPLAFRVSLPIPPSMESLPVGANLQDGQSPLMKSLPPPPQMKSFPPLAKMASGPELPTITSVPAVPCTVPLPGATTIVATRPKQGVAADAGAAATTVPKSTEAPVRTAAKNSRGAILVIVVSPQLGDLAGRRSAVTVRRRQRPTKHPDRIRPPRSAKCPDADNHRAVRSLALSHAVRGSARSRIRPYRRRPDRPAAVVEDLGGQPVVRMDQRPDQRRLAGRRAAGGRTTRQDHHRGLLPGRAAPAQLRPGHRGGTDPAPRPGVRDGLAPVAPGDRRAARGGHPGPSPGHPAAGSGRVHRPVRRAGPAVPSWAPRRCGSDRRDGRGGQDAAGNPRWARPAPGEAVRPGPVRQP